MKKQFKAAISLLLLFSLLATAVFPVFAEEAEDAPSGTTIVISSLDDFLAFAESCILDTYSKDMTVSLGTDLDLTDVDFSGIGIFSGTFEGNNHTVSGLSMKKEGSVQGLFRYLTGSAYVKDLTIRGNVLSEGSRQTVGGIAGSNSGRIENCTFVGEVSGSDYVGGLVGTNQVSGIIEGCRVEGNVHGNHFIGGMAGENYGLIRNCRNESGINTTATENSVGLSDITPDTITGTESANTVTDVGGIAGTSTGVIRNCENHGTVGYQHMGYNIGGIAGSQNGFITECKNYGHIYGRKEVAGIVGQMEPISKIEYTADTLQILRDQLTSTSALANQASSNVNSHAQDISNQISSLHGQADTAIDAVQQLIPSEENPHLPDADALQAAKNTLTSSMTSMQGTISSINDSTRAGVSSASNDIRAITNQINAMADTLNNANETLGGTITDVSDSDTPDDLSGKISLCKNLGPVDGDLNIGGIVGAVARENDLDPEDDFQFNGDPSLNFESEMRAVVLDSQNDALITAKKRNAGGIAGNLSLGLVKGCVNTGFVEAEDAEHIGGIAGASFGFIRNCNAKCKLKGKTFVGGIAGEAPIVSDCRSMVQVQDGIEKLGSILGVSASTKNLPDNPITGNFYLPVDENLGAVDGINYSGVAESLSLDAFLALENLPDVFRNATMTFLYEDATVEEITVPLGNVVEASQIPAIPEKEGFVAKWNHLEDTNLQNVCFDVVMEPEYTPCRKVIQSKDLREDGKPILLAEGQFDELTQIDLTPVNEFPTLADNVTAVEAWEIPKFAENTETQLRLALPENLEVSDAKIMVKNGEGSWVEIPHTVDGSYLVFSVNSSDQAICLVNAPDNGHLKAAIFAGIILAVMIVVIAVVLRKRKKKRKATKAS